MHRVNKCKISMICKANKCGQDRKNNYNENWAAHLNRSNWTPKIGLTPGRSMGGCVYGRLFIPKKQVCRAPWKEETASSIGEALHYGNLMQTYQQCPSVRVTQQPSQWPLLLFSCQQLDSTIFFQEIVHHYLPVIILQLVSLTLKWGAPHQSTGTMAVFVNPHHFKPST